MDICRIYSKAPKYAHTFCRVSFGNSQLYLFPSWYDCQVSRAGTSNYIPQISWDVIIVPALDTCFWHKHSTANCLYYDNKPLGIFYGTYCIQNILMRAEVFYPSDLCEVTLHNDGAMKTRNIRRESWTQSFVLRQNFCGMNWRTDQIWGLTRIFILFR